MVTTAAPLAARTRPVRRVSRPGEAAERQADRAADVVARGGDVSGWTFLNIPVAAAPVHRQPAGQPQTPAGGAKEALTKTAEAALETAAGKALKQRILDDPLVRAVTKAITSPVGIGVGIAGGVAGIGALAATGSELPLQPPFIPLDRIVPGLSAKIVWKGPVNRPTEVGLTLAYREQGPAAKPGPTAGERYRAETERLAADQERFRAGLRYAPGSQEARDRQAEQEAIARLVGRLSSLPGMGRPLIPLVPGGAPTIAEPRAEDENPLPVQRSTAGTSDASTNPAGVPSGFVSAAVGGPGRAIESPVRRSMEAAFGRDFSQVRIHDGPTAAGAAHTVAAAAFTVGSDIVFGAGRYDPASRAGRHLLAHELVHVAQTGGRATDSDPIHRFAAYSAAEQAAGASSGWLHPGGDPLRVSDDGQLAVEDHGWGEGTNKRAWTTPALIATANGVLGAQGSRAKLRAKPGEPPIFGNAPTTGAASTLVAVEPYKPAGGGPFDLARDCGHAARQVMGSGPVGRDVAVLQRPAEPADTGTRGAIAGGIVGALGGGAIGALLGSLAGPVGTAVGAVIGGVAGLIGGIFAGRAIGRHQARPAREQYLTPRTYHGGPPTTPPEEWSEEVFREDFGAGLTRAEAYAAYAALSPSERDDFDRRHGINRYATPRIGQGLTVGTEYDMPGFSTGGRRTWNFHYAATVLTSGPDYVTLESAARWHPEKWIFYLYGTALGQSFHEEHAATRTHGSHQTTFVVQPEKNLDVRTVAPGATLRTETGAVSLPVGTSLRVIERRPRPIGSADLHVRVTGGPHDGAEGELSEADVR